MAMNYPVFIEETFNGKFWGHIIHEPNIAAFDTSPQGVCRQLKEALLWLARKQAHPGPLTITGEQLLTISVPLRPEYNVNEKRYPCSEIISLRVSCYFGADEDDSLLCFIPKVSESFHFFEKNKLKELVQYSVQNIFKGASPAEIISYLPGKSEQLMNIQIPTKKTFLGWGSCKKMRELDIIGTSMNSRPSNYGKAWEREEIVQSMLQSLDCEQGANILLVGEPGVGKTAILHEVATAFRKLKTSRPLWLSSGSRIVSGMSYFGQWEARCQKIVMELASLKGVLVIDDLMGLVSAGKIRKEDSGVAEFLMPFLVRGDFTMIVEATPDTLAACRRILPGFTDLFKVITVAECDRSKTLKILDSFISQLSRNQMVETEIGISSLIYQLFARFIPYRKFPGKVVEFLYELLPQISKEKKIDRFMVIESFLKKTGLPEIILRDDIPLDSKDVLDFFHKQVIGQEEACLRVTELVCLYKSGINDPGKPVASFLFCGPTGVGKTEMAKALGKYFFQSKNEKREALIRLDMSEYSTLGSATRLLGGEYEPGELGQKIREQPFSVVLLDEIEKAAPEVFDVLLSILGEGRMSDSLGRVIDFRNAIIIMTSNLGVSANSALGFKNTKSENYSGAVAKFFRPELFNRLDAIIPFLGLEKESLRDITQKELRKVEKRVGMRRRSISLEIDDNLLEHIIQKGYKPEYGARPLKRMIEEFVATPLSFFLVKNPHFSQKKLRLCWEKKQVVVQPL